MTSPLPCPARWTLALLVLGLSATAGVGCNSKRDGQGTLLATGTGAATAGITSGATPGALPPGTPPIAGMPQAAALDGPSIEITSPVPGAAVTGPRVTVEGVVTDLGLGVAEVHVAGRTVPIDPSGVFRAEVDVTPGVETILVEAWDTTQRRRARHVSVVAGDLAAETDLLPGAAAIRASDAALDLIEPQVAQGVEAQRAQIVQQVLATRLGNDTKMTGFRFGAVGADVDAIQGGARFTISIADLAMDIEHKAKILFVFNTTKRGTIRAQRLDIEGTAAISVQAGQPSVRMIQVVARTQGFSVPDWADGEEGNIRRGLEQSFAQAAAPAFDQALQAAFRTTAGTQAQTVAGKPVRVDWRLERLAFDDDGLTAVLGANVQADRVVNANGPTGSVARRRALPTLAGGGQAGSTNAGLALGEDLLARALHAAWRAGAMDMRLDAAAAQRMGVPALDTTALLLLAPELSQVVAPGLPVVLDVKATLPPTLTVNASGQHRLALGGLRVTTLVQDPQQGLVPLADADWAIEADVTLVARGGQLVLEPGAAPPVCHVDTVGAAAPGTETVLDRMAPARGAQLLRAALAGQGALTAPALPGFTLDDLRPSAVDGALVVLGTAKPAATQAP